MESTIYNRGRARRSMIDTVSFRVLSQIATALGLVVLVRGMPEREFGVYSLLYTFIAVVGTVLSLGLEQVMMRYQPEYLRAGNKVAAAWLVRVIAAGRLLANIIIITVVLVFWNEIAPLFKLTPYRTVFAFFSLLILLHFQTQILQLALASHMMHRFSVGSMSIMSFVKTLGYGALYAAHLMDLQTALCVDAAGYLCAYTSMRVVYKRRCLTADARGPYRPGTEERKRLVRYGLYNNFNDVGGFFLYSTMDNFFIAAYLDTLSVGIYAFYTRLRQMVVNALPAKLFDNIVKPMFFAIPADQADRNVPRFFSFLLNMNLLVQWPALAFATAYHSELVRVVFHGKFIEDSWLLPLLMLIATFNLVSDPVTIVAQYEEKAHVLLYSKITAAYNILAMLALVPFLGVYGAALAGGSAQTMKNAVVWWFVRKRAVWTNAGAALMWGIGLWGAAVGVCYALKTLLPMPPLARLVVGAVVFSLTALIHVRSRALSGSDRDILRSIVPGKAVPIMQRLGVLAR